MTPFLSAPNYPPRLASLAHFLLIIFTLFCFDAIHSSFLVYISVTLSVCLIFQPFTNIFTSYFLHFSSLLVAQHDFTPCMLTETRKRQLKRGFHLFNLRTFYESFSTNKIAEKRTLR